MREGGQYGGGRTVECGEPAPASAASYNSAGSKPGGDRGSEGRARQISRLIRYFHRRSDVTLPLSVVSVGLCSVSGPF